MIILLVFTLLAMLVMMMIIVVVLVHMFWLLLLLILLLDILEALVLILFGLRPFAIILQGEEGQEEGVTFLHHLRFGNAVVGHDRKYLVEDLLSLLEGDALLFHVVGVVGVRKDYQQVAHPIIVIIALHLAVLNLVQEFVL
jgi:hypothetical protein